MSPTASHHQERRLGPLKGLAVAFAAAGLLAGCSMAAASPSPTSVALPSPSVSPSVIPTATPSSTPTSMPSIGVAPSGQWTGIRWISADQAFPQTPTAGSDKGSFVTVSVYGWSRGYVGFRTAIEQGSSPSMTMVSTFSADGLNWTAGRPLATGSLDSWVDVTQVAEGPSGLLAVGRYPGAACGGPATIDALWTSIDGLTWSLVQPSAAFGSARVSWVGGGSTGYIASGILKDGKTQAVWLSEDGRSWTQVPLTSPAFGRFVLDGAADFAGGYVISGAVLKDAGCGQTWVTPSIWWSADGKSWSRSQLPGAANANDAWITTTKVSDHALMAIADEWNEATQVSSRQVWVSNDGRAWKLAASPSGLLGNDIMTDGQRGLVVVEPGPGAEGPPTVATVGDDLTVKTLSQTGNVPIYSAAVSPNWLTALGPTGVVILSSDGLDLWLGVPAAS
jgi:hypothetical protein